MQVSAGVVAVHWHLELVNLVSSESDGIPLESGILTISSLVTLIHIKLHPTMIQEQ